MRSLPEVDVTFPNCCSPYQDCYHATFPWPLPFDLRRMQLKFTSVNASVFKLFLLHTGFQVDYSGYISVTAPDITVDSNMVKGTRVPLLVFCL